MSLQEKLQETLGAAYRIERELPGAGMSRVFVATEVELERTVVVKVLPPDLAAGINTERFRREIQLAAKLQHPHIVPLLFAGARGGILFYTMPFIEGESLRARLAKSRELPIPEAIRVVMEVADALAYAHARGVVHRDIKPENVLISGNHIVVTDFGVAKALTSATGETSLTSMGVALGTPAYMAPEQATADPLTDHRADIYALGVLAYELLAGRPPFTGLNPQQVLSAHVTSQPEPVVSHRATVPPQLADVVMRCLEKNPADRWQTAEEVRAQLAAVLTPSGGMLPVRSAATQPVPARATPQRIAVIAGAAGLLVAAAVLSSIAFRGGDDEYVIGTTRQITSASGREMHPALSPDGKIVAFAGQTPTGDQLFIRYVDGGRTIQLTSDTLQAGWPLWAPDGTRLIYINMETVSLVPVLGGTPSVLLPVEPPRWINPAGFSPDGTKLAYGVEHENTVVVSNVDGSSPRTLATVPEPHSPSWSPDGSRLAVVSGNISWVWDANLAPSAIWIVPVTGGTARKVTDDLSLNTSPVWTPDGGSILFVSSRGGGRDIYRLKIARDGSASGAPVRMTTGLGPHTISLSRDGRLLAYATLVATSNIWTMPIPDRPTTAEGMRRVTDGAQTIEGISISPDGKWLAYDSNLQGNSDIYRIPVTGGEPVQITRDPADDFNPDWSPDGSEIAFHSFRHGDRDVFVVAADGRSTQEVVRRPGHQRGPRWHPRGEELSFYEEGTGVFTVQRTGGPGGKWGTPRLLTSDPEADARFEVGSPDGQLVVYVRERALFVRSAVGGDGRRLFDPGAFGIGGIGGLPTWSADSRTIYFQAWSGRDNAAIWRVAAAGGTPTTLIRFTDPSRQFYRPALASDGRNFYFTIGSRESDIWVMELSKK
ncbi:MAG TPA: protein kinase [Gemmatimonadaceae bacterium]